MQKPIISIIVAHSKNMAIGKKNKIPWHIPDDLKRFKLFTTGHAVIMGRKTFQSLGQPLPNRTNIVISHDFKHGGAIVVPSLEEAIKKAKEIEEEEIFIIGGGKVYAEALPLIDRLYVTTIDQKVDGDAFFPEYDHLFSREVYKEVKFIEGVKIKYFILEK